MPSWFKANGMNSAAATAVFKSAGEARPPGIAKQSVTTKLNSQRLHLKLGLFQSGAGGMNSTAVTADAIPADEARLREQFHQLWDVPHNRELLVKGLRGFFQATDVLAQVMPSCESGASSLSSQILVNTRDREERANADANRQNQSRSTFLKSHTWTKPPTNNNQKAQHESTSTNLRKHNETHMHLTSNRACLSADVWTKCLHNMLGFRALSGELALPHACAAMLSAAK